MLQQGPRKFFLGAAPPASLIGSDHFRKVFGKYKGYPKRTQVKRQAVGREETGASVQSRIGVSQPLER